MVFRRRARILAVVAAALIAVVTWSLRPDGVRRSAAVPRPPGATAEPQRDEPRPELRVAQVAERSIVAPEAPVVEAPAASAERAVVTVTVRRRDTGETVGNCGVRLRLRDLESGPVSFVDTARTDDAGRCTLAAPLGEALVVEAGGELWERGRGVGEASEELPALAAGARPVVELVLPAGTDTEFWGRVVDEQTGAPLPGARVVRQEDRPANFAASWLTERALAVADPEGRFRVPVASWARPEPHVVELRDYGASLFLPDADHADPARPVDLALRRCATLVIRVYDHGVPGFGSEGRVRLGANSYELAVPDGTFINWRDPVWTAALDAEGRCTLQVPARVPLRGAVQGTDRAETVPDALTLEPGERREVEWRFGEGTRVTGVLLDQLDAPVADQEVWITNHSLAGEPWDGTAIFYGGDVERVHDSARTDEVGRFEFADVPAGRWWLGPMAPRLDPAPTPDAIVPLAQGVALAGEPTLEVVLRTWRGLTIRGRVLDPSGEPAAREHVRARGIDVGGFVSARSGADGSFVLGPLAPGEYELHAGSFGKHASAEPVRARDGDEDVVLHLREAGSLRGEVVDAASGAPVRAQVRISHRGPGFRRSLAADDGGAFRMDGLEPGLHDVVASTTDGRAGTVSGVEVRGGEESGPVRVSLEAGARVTVRYTGPSTFGNFTVYSGEVPVAFDGLRTGTSQTATTPAGALRVELKTRDGSEQTLSIVVAPGEEREVLFELP